MNHELEGKFFHLPFVCKVIIFTLSWFFCNLIILQSVLFMKISSMLLLILDSSTTKGNILFFLPWCRRDGHSLQKVFLLKLLLRIFQHITYPYFRSYHWGQLFFSCIFFLLNIYCIQRWATQTPKMISLKIWDCCIFLNEGVSVKTCTYPKDSTAIGEESKCLPV